MNAPPPPPTDDSFCVSVKCALRKSMVRCGFVHRSRRRLLTQIRRDVIECTQIATLASGLIHFVFNAGMQRNNRREIAIFSNKVDNGPRTSQTVNFIILMVFSAKMRSRRVTQSKNTESMNISISWMNTKFIHLSLCNGLIYKIYIHICNSKQFASKNSKSFFSNECILFFIFIVVLV